MICLFSMSEGCRGDASSSLKTRRWGAGRAPNVGSALGVEPHTDHEPHEQGPLEKLPMSYVAFE